MNKSIINYINILNNDGVIITSTDTVPAIICNALSDMAVKKIYNLKQRKTSKPIAIFCANTTMAKDYLDINDLNTNILDHFTPGPLTLILKPKSETVLAKSLNSLDASIALRIPDNKFLQNLMIKANMPLAATSANISGDSISFLKINEHFSDKVDLIDIENQKNILEPSSIFKIENNYNIKEIRQGTISKKQIEELLSNYKS